MLYIAYRYPKFAKFIQIRRSRACQASHPAMTPIAFAAGHRSIKFSLDLDEVTRFAFGYRFVLGLSLIHI